MSVEHVATEPSSSPGSNLGSLGQGRRAMPISLIISPNLDALLEHEEQRKRAQDSTNTNTNANAIETQTPDSSQQQNPAAQGKGTMAPSVEIPKGLPPPPRRVKGPKSPISPIVAPIVVWGTAEEVERGRTEGKETSSRSNPYINRAPTLEDVLQGEKRDGSKTVTGNRRPHDRSRPEEDDDRGWIQQSPYLLDSRHVTHHHHLLISSSNTRPQIVMPEPMPQTAISNSSTVLDDHDDARLGRSSPAVAKDPPNTLWHRRPLISHAHNSSVSSSDSANTSSTHPASTEENGPRISISSTIYQPSSDHSHHNHQIYNHRSSYDMARNSFMELYSPANPAFSVSQVSPAETNPEPLSPINFSRSPVSEDNYTPYHNDQPFHSFDAKPPLPTTPKPLFNRHVLRSRQASPKRSTPSPTRHEQKVQETRLPPTTNFLDVEERADLVRKSRKLARVFGQTPGADAMAQQDTGYFTSQTASKPMRKGAAAFNLATNPRRHSMPLTPDDVSFLSIVSPTFETYPTSSKDEAQEDAADKSKSGYNRQTTRESKPSSRSSFIDLSDDEKEVALPSGGTPPAVLSSSPPSSLLETMSLDDQQDDERRRKRERLAKLHRFLGSRVPANLVLGFDDVEASLPAESKPPSAYRSTSENEDGSTRKVWLKRRRSSSTGVVPSSWSGDLDRVKEELDDKEKALNVRRAQKMEKVFGVAPPLTLYHTRHCPSPSSVPPAKSLPPLPSPVTPDGPVTPTLINFSSNRATYAKTKTKKNGRPGTSESSKQLLPKGPGSDQAVQNDIRHSLIYTHYHHSLNSLNDIIDRDDRESLAELHEYLNGAEVSTLKATGEDSLAFPSPPTGTGTRLERQASIASTIKSERRRSLPARTSVISLAGSEYTISSTPRAEITTFQVRRRRAAKLTQFFGVNYRELISDILDSIESGVENEHMQGTLREEEFEDLRSRLRNMKIKRQGVF